MSNHLRIVFVLPCYNEEESLPHTIAELKKVRKQLASTADIDFIFVNDGSSDRTLELLEEAAAKDDFVLYRSFAANAGHQSALRAGLNAAVDYDAAVMLDADLQHPPELIPEMIEKWQEGNKVVQMVREEEDSEVSKGRELIGKTYYKFINFISDIELEAGASDFRLVDQSVLKLVAESPEKNLFLRGYFAWIPVSRTTIEYKPAARVAGVSKYTFKKLLQLSYNSILQFSDKPLRVSVTLGIVMAAASFLAGILIIILHLLGASDASGWASMMTALAFLFGLNFILLGIIGHYLGHSINLSKKRPEFVVAQQKLRKKSNDS